MSPPGLPLEARAVQPPGAVMLVDADWSLAAWSVNLPTMLGTKVEPRFGLPAADLVDRKFAHDLRGWAQSLGQARARRVLAHPCGRISLDLQIQALDDGYLIEFEPPDPAQAGIDTTALVRRLLDRLEGAAGRDEAAQAGTTIIRLFARADRVRLLGDAATGAVLAHSARPGLEVAGPLVLEPAWLQGPVGHWCDHDEPANAWIDGRPPERRGIALGHASLADHPALAERLREQDLGAACWFPLHARRRPGPVLVCERCRAQPFVPAVRDAVELAARLLSLALSG